MLTLAGCGGGSAPPHGAAAQDAAAYHTVAKGDTVYAISRRYGAPVRSIISANGLKPPYTIHVGERLRVPAPAVHVVSKGDTVFSISRRYDVEMAELTRVNGIGPPYTIHVGDRIAIPGRDGGMQVASAAGDPSSAPSSPPPPTAAGRFTWPLSGKLVSTFGAKSGGLRNDGINIEAPRGAKVHAAENGTVVYAGNGIQGFGNLLLVKHSGGYMTAYGHNEVLLVERGQTVRRGEVIARVGSTGNVGSPQLHFEIRKGKRAVDPMAYLGAPQTALASPAAPD